MKRQLKPFAKGRWAGETIVCVASGPSLSDAQLARLGAASAAGACRVIAVNDNYRSAPFADVLYACDRKWWDHYIEGVRLNFQGELWTCSRIAADRYKLYHVEGVSRPGLSRMTGVLHYGGNTGYQAIGLAYQFGAARIILIGYDMQRTGDRSHWFGDHPPGFANAPSLAKWAVNYAALARDLKMAAVPVINCSIETALTCFERSELEALL